MERNKKQKVVEELGAKLSKVNCMFIAEYSGMSVAQITRLRRELRSVGVEFNVVKNTLLAIAAEGTKAAILKDKFSGPNAIVCIYDDPVSAAKIFQSFAKDMPQLKMKAGFLGDKMLSPEEIVVLATLPSRDMLIAKLLGLLQSMPQRLLYVLQGNISKLLYTLDAIKEQKAQA